MLYIHDIDGVMDERIGARGLSAAELASALARAEDALGWLRRRGDGQLAAFIDTPARSDDLALCREVAARLSSGASDVVVFGAGGSSLGGQMLAQLAGYRVPGEVPAPPPHQPRPRLHFFDNLDAASLTNALNRLDLKTTRFLTVSKSGTTPETVVQAALAIAALEAAGLAWNMAAHMIMLTGPGDDTDNALRRLAARHGLDVIDHDPDIGGRYSLLTNVGLIPALIAGVDAAAVRSGAGQVIDAAMADQPAADTPPALGAAVNVAAIERGDVNASVIMPYAERLRLFSAWYCQLWAESLGKNGLGIQPVAAAGPVDQHSQLQLFLDGPADKLFTLITTETAGHGLRVAESERNDPLLGAYAGRAIGDLVDCQQRAVGEALIARGRPVRTLHIDALNEHTLGALAMHFMLETLLVGRMLGVNPLDQPAVELAKTLTRRYLETM